MEVLLKSIHSSVNSNRKILLIKYIVDSLVEKIDIVKSDALHLPFHIFIV